MYLGLPTSQLAAAASGQQLTLFSLTFSRHFEIYFTVAASTVALAVVAFIYLPFAVAPSSVESWFLFVSGFALRDGHGPSFDVRHGTGNEIHKTITLFFPNNLIFTTAANSFLDNMHIGVKRKDPEYEFASRGSRAT